MDVAVIDDLVARSRRSEATALHAIKPDRPYTYFDLCNTAAKAANVLRHVGVRRGDGVVLADDLAPEVVLSFLGTALVGGIATIGAHPETVESESTSAIVVPADAEGSIDPSPGVALICYGSSPDRPETTHWEAEVWSENPASPPGEHGPEDRVLIEPETEREFTHAELLAAARTVVEEYELAGDARVAIGGALSDPGTIAAGIVAPLIVGGTILLQPSKLTEATIMIGDSPRTEETATLNPDRLPL